MTYYLQDLVFIDYFGALRNTSLKSWLVFQDWAGILNPPLPIWADIEQKNGEIVSLSRVSWQTCEAREESRRFHRRNHVNIGSSIVSCPVARVPYVGELLARWQQSAARYVFQRILAAA